MAADKPSDNPVDNQGQEKNVEEILHSVRHMMESDISSLREESEESENTEVIDLSKMIKPPRGYKTMRDYNAKSKSDKTPPVAPPEKPITGDISGDIPSDKTADGEPILLTAPMSESDKALKAEIRKIVEPMMLEWLDKKLAPMIRETLDSEVKHLVRSMVQEAMKKPKGD